LLPARDWSGHAPVVRGLVGPAVRSAIVAIAAAMRLPSTCGRVERRGRVTELEATLPELAKGNRKVAVRGRTLKPARLGEGVRQYLPRLAVAQLAISSWA
jgi:hypothetical protein